MKYLLVRIWHFCLCKAYLSDLVIFVMFSACVICICQIFYFSGFFSACIMFACQMRVGAREVYTVCLSQMHHWGDTSMAKEGSQRCEGAHKGRFFAL